MSTPNPASSFRYGILLYPGFELLDIAGPLEILNMLSAHPSNAGMSLSIIARTMEPVSPYLPPPSDAASPAPIPVPMTSSENENENASPPAVAPTSRFHGQQRWLPTHTFDDAPQLDVLLVPGGVGSIPPADIGAEAEFLERVYRGYAEEGGKGGREELKYLFTICNGAVIAAKGALSLSFFFTSAAASSSINHRHHHLMKYLFRIFSPAPQLAFIWD